MCHLSKQTIQNLRSPKLLRTKTCCLLPSHNSLLQEVLFVVVVVKSKGFVFSSSMLSFLTLHLSSNSNLEPPVCPFRHFSKAPQDQSKKDFSPWLSIPQILKDIAQWCNRGIAGEVDRRHGASHTVYLFPYATTSTHQLKFSIHWGRTCRHKATGGAMAACSVFLTLKCSYKTESRKIYTDQVTHCCSLLTDPNKTWKWKCKCIHKCCFAKNTTNVPSAFPVPSL